MTQEFRLESHLLGVRRFDLAEGVSGEEAATLLTLWVGQVLDEYGLEWSSISGVTIDGGGGGGGGAWGGSDFDVCRGIPGVLLERCIPSGLDRAMREAFGLVGRVRGGVENKAARDVLEGVMKAVENMDTLEMTQVFGCCWDTDVVYLLKIDVYLLKIDMYLSKGCIRYSTKLLWYIITVVRYMCTFVCCSCIFRVQTYLSEILL